MDANNQTSFIEHTLDTDLWEPEERWPMYKHCVQSALPYEVDMRLHSYHGDFRAETTTSVNINNQGSLTVSSNTGNAIARDKKHIEDGYSEYMLLYIVDGTGIVKRGDEICTLQSGHIYIVDMAQTFLTDFSSRCKTMYSRIPRHRLEPLIKGPKDNRLIKIDQSSGPGYLLRNYLLMLPRAIRCSRHDTADSLFNPLADLTNACLIERNSGQTKIINAGRNKTENINIETDTATILLYQRMHHYLKEHSQEPNFSINTLAQHFRYSSSYCQRIFRQNKTTFSKEVQRLRIENACEQLMRSSGKAGLLDIAMACGFQGQSQFSRAFKAELGISARDFAKEGCN